MKNTDLALAVSMYIIGVIVLNMFFYIDSIKGMVLVVSVVVMYLIYIQIDILNDIRNTLKEDNKDEDR